jgi:putative membrane protein
MRHIVVMTTVRVPVRTVSRREGFLLVTILAAALVWSAIGARSLGTWALEVVWILIGAPLVLLNRRRFPLTRLVCWLLVGHAIVLCYGGHYTYAQTPLGDWLRDVFDWQRNNYDRIAHFVQGFVPAMLVRELLLRLTPLRRGGWTFTLTVAVCLSVSACFEFVEWASAVILGAGADDFLGTQGDVWDTQWDMFLCLCGAIVAQLVLSRVHDRQLRPR